MLEGTGSFFCSRPQKTKAVDRILSMTFVWYVSGVYCQSSDCTNEDHAESESSFHSVSVFRKFAMPMNHAKVS